MATTTDTSPKPRTKPKLARVTVPGVAKILLDPKTTVEQLEAVIDALLLRIAEPELALVPQLVGEVYRQAHPEEAKAWKVPSMAAIEKRRLALHAEAKNGTKEEPKAD